MMIVHVAVHVLPDAVDAFVAATIENARNSVKEAGVIRFDFIRQEDDASRFLLVEIYRTPSDAVLHKETAYYATWRDTVAPLMASPRSSIKYQAIFPAPDAW